MGRFFRGASIGLGLLLLLFIALVAWARLSPPTPSLGSALALLKLLFQMGLFALVSLALIKLLAKLPVGYVFVLACSLAVLYYHFRGFEAWGQFWTAFFFIVPVSVFGGCIAFARGSKALWPRLGLVLSFFALGYSAIFFFRAGFAEEPPENAASLGGSVTELDLPSPASRGRFGVAFLTYGSGRDRHRPEFGAEADLVTDPVDGSAFIDGWEDRSGWARTQYWGFDAESLPLQGRVWYAAGDGPFPLVLIVHGNHSMEDFSDPGYGYLGELFASRGYIFVSVDENFINSSFSARLDGLSARGLEEENDARGWLLLKHLELWRGFNDDANNPFFERVDLSRIGLIGHSRGGEAVAVAAALNRLERYPDDASVVFDFGFDIKGVAAIAPVDGQYQPAGRGTPLRDTNYFVLHGSHDGDVQSFAGSRQFERVELSGEGFRFKASLYVYGANHGQFNSTWGRSDSSFPGKNILNLAHIMPESEQAEIARVYLSAFFEAALREEHGYLPLFADARAGGAWLPETVYLSHYQDSRFRVVAGFEEDLDVTTATVQGGELAGENLSTWREQLVELKHDDKATSAVYLGWGGSEDNSGTARYVLRLPDGYLTAADDALWFTLADAGPQEQDDEDGDEAEDPRPPDESEPVEDPEPVDFTIEIEDVEGNVGRLPLSAFSLLQPKIEVQVRKSALFNRTRASEPVYQSFRFPLAAFEPELSESTLDATRLREIRFVFDRSERGSVILDHVAFRREPVTEVSPVETEPADVPLEPPPDLGVRIPERDHP